MKVKILGSGCKNCKKLEQMTKDILNDLNVENDIVKITDFKEYPKYGVAFTPALVIDDTLLISGKVPTREELSGIIKKYLYN